MLFPMTLIVLVLLFIGMHPVWPHKEAAIRFPWLERRLSRFHKKESMNNKEDG